MGFYSKHCAGITTGVAYFAATILQAADQMHVRLETSIRISLPPLNDPPLGTRSAERSAALWRSPRAASTRTVSETSQGLSGSLAETGQHRESRIPVRAAPLRPIEPCPLPFTEHPIRYSTQAMSEW